MWKGLTFCQWERSPRRFKKACLCFLVPGLALFIINLAHFNFSLPFDQLSRYFYGLVSGAFIALFGTVLSALLFLPYTPPISVHRHSTSEVFLSHQEAFPFASYPKGYAWRDYMTNPLNPLYPIIFPSPYHFRSRDDDFQPSSLTLHPPALSAPDLSGWHIGSL